MKPSAIRRQLLAWLSAGALTPFGARAQHVHKGTGPDVTPALPAGPAIRLREEPYPPSPPSHMREEPFTRALRVPGAEGLLGVLAVKSPLVLTAQLLRQQLLGGRSTEMLAYECHVAGKALMNPTLHARVGEVLDVTLVNKLGEDTTIHWHGLHVDERNDGSGMHPVRHNESYGYRFRVANRPGLYWYHPHPHRRTGLQVHQGLGGLLVVEDAGDERLRRELGLEPGITEIALLLQDKQIDDRNRLKYSVGEDDWIGNHAMLNWTPKPRLEAMTCLYRFRILNGANARVFRLAFESGRRRLPFTLIGTDGGLLDRPRAVNELFVAPAQRVDILLDLEKAALGSAVMMRSLAYDPMENDAGAALIDPAVEHPGAPLMGEAMDLMRIELKTSICAPRRIPATFGGPLKALKPSGPRRKFRLHADGPRWLLNGRNYYGDMHRVEFTAKAGTVETWEIRNDLRSMPHPMHLHGFHCRVVSRRGSPPQVARLAIAPGGRSAHDLGWLDTVLVWPGETVTIAVDFGPAPPGRNLYMFHCHNLEHEDQGLMLNFATES